MIKHHQPDKFTPNQPAADSVQDRIQQQRDQEAFRQLEEKYHRLFNAIDEAFCTIEVLFDDQGKAVDYRFLETNPAFLRQTGIENVIGQRVLEVVPNLEPFWFDTYGHVAKTGDAIRFEHQALAMNRYYDVYAFPVDEPNLNHVAVIVNDITQRKCHQANLAFLAEVSQELAGLTNIDETMTALGAKIAGYFKLVEVIFGEMSHDEQTVHISHEWHRADYPAVKGTYTVNAYFSPEFERLHRTGQIGIVRDTANDERVDAAGYTALGIGAFVNVPIIHQNKWRFNVTLLDANPRDWRADEIELMRELITRIWTRLDRARTEEALRESQERLRLVLDASGMGTFLWYPQEDRTEADARAFTLLGLGENDTITLAQSLASSIHPDDRERYATAVARALERKGEGKLDLDYRIVQPDGSLHWLHIYGHTFFSSEKPTRAKLMYGLFLDITQRKRHEAHLAFLAEVSQELVRLTTISETMNALGAKIGHHFMASRCAFFEFNEAMESAVCQYDWHAVNEPSLVGSYRTADYYTDEFLETMRAGEAFVVTDREADSRADATNLAALRIASCIVIPIITRQQSLFVLAINDTVPRDWHQDQIELMRELAERIWTRLDRARAEDALHESQKRFESIANLVPDLLWHSQPDGSTNWYNQRWLEYTGQTFEEAIGWGWTEAIYPDDREASDSRYREAVAAGTSLQQEHRIRRHDGIYRWFVVSAAPLKNARGQVVKMYGAATDIHERKLAETALHKSEERWRLAIEATELATWEWHLDTNEVYWNEQHFRLFGMEPQAGPLSPDAFMRHVHPHEQARIKELLERAIAERGVYDTEFCAVLEDGSTRWMSGYGCITEERDGQPVRMSGVMLDVDERRRAQEALLASEQKFRTLSDAAPALIWQHDGQGRNQFVNQRFIEFVGLTTQQLEGVGWQSIIHPDDQQAYIADYLGAVGEQRGFSHTNRLRRADGQWRWFANYAQPLFSQGGQFLGHVGASVDITDRQQQAETLRVADRRKDEFLAMLAHELRNPLAPIRNGLQLLGQTPTTDPTLSVLLPIMNRNMTHVVRMIDDLLDVSRISRGKIELTRHRIELVALVRQALESMRPQYASASRQLRAVLPAAPLYLLGDATRLNQVVTNLLTNGLRYTGEDGQVQLSLEAVDGQALLQVSDNGIGLSVDQLDAIFELFVQVDNSLARSNGGLGLGLSLVQQLVEQHGGRVKAQSPGLGQGSTFSIYLPLD